MDNPVNQGLSGAEFTRLANNFYQSKNIPADYQRITTDADLANYIVSNRAGLKKHKVAFTFICLNPLYWEFARRMVDSARLLFLPGHNVDFLFWTDIPEDPQEIGQKMAEAYGQVCAQREINPTEKWVNDKLNVDIQGVLSLKNEKNIKLFPIEPIEWPFPTLLRYNLFLQQEEILKNYDYIFYCDIDMLFVNVVGDEILGDGLTAAPHPGYEIRKEYVPPYEPNPESECYIPRPGRIINDNGKPRFMPFYAAGGFQGGKSDRWISAMKEMRKMIDKDLSRNYIPIWNDESVWNKYLFLNPPSIYLNPSYVCPDSAIKEYYEPLWGMSYFPRLITLTKWFSLSKQGGEHLMNFLKK